jgi:hypothetical protein
VVFWELQDPACLPVNYAFDLYHPVLSVTLLRHNIYLAVTGIADTTAVCGLVG